MRIQLGTTLNSCQRALTEAVARAQKLQQCGVSIQAEVGEWRDQSALKGVCG